MVEEKDYRYKELCMLMNEKVKTGKSKQLQLQNWKRFFNWENPTKQIFRVTEVYDTPKEKTDHRGGARAGAGAKPKVQEQFDILIQKYIHLQFEKNVYYRNLDSWIYFNNDSINKFFGIYKNMYKALAMTSDGTLLDEKVNLTIHKEIMDKLREKSRSWILNKMSNTEGITLKSGIIAYINVFRNDYHARDDLLDSWNEAQINFMQEHNFKTIKQVIDANMWQDMEIYITAMVNAGLDYENSPVQFVPAAGYQRIKKFHKIEFNPDYFFQKDIIPAKTVNLMRASLNRQVVKEVYDFFLKKKIEKFDSEYESTCLTYLLDDLTIPDKPVFDEFSKMEDYIYILNTYVAINDENKINILK